MQLDLAPPMIIEIRFNEQDVLRSVSFSDISATLSFRIPSRYRDFIPLRVMFPVFNCTSGSRYSNKLCMFM